MRIAMLVHAFPVLSETFILRQITGLIDRGHEIDIFAAANDATGKVHPAVDEYRLLDRTYYRSWIREDYHLIDRASYQSWLPARSRAYSYDVIHCHFGPMGLTGAALRDAGLFAGALITSFYGFDLSSFPQKEGPDVYADLFRRGNLCTANSAFLVDKAVSLGCSTDKIVKLPVGLDLSAYIFRQRVHRRGEPIKVLTVGRFVEKKGIEYALRAVATVARKHPDLEYCIVGDGPLRGPLEDLIAELNLADTVRLVGWQAESALQRLYDEASIFLLSSVTAQNGDQEGMGLVILEAQAVGLPVLSTQHDGIPEAVVDGQSAFLVPERDVDALADRLTYLIEHPDIWPHMAQVGRAHVEDQYDIEVLNDRLAAIYREVV